MVTSTDRVLPFDHRQAGTPETRWTRRGFDDLTELSVPGPDSRVVVVAAHPDDETLGAGGLIAAAAARGADVRVIVATDGEASHPQSPTHTPVQLAGVRRAEVRAAVAALHPALEPVFLGLPDGRLAEHPCALASMLGEHVRGATHLVTTWVGDRHPDHEACARAVAELRPPGARHWQYPIWAWHWDEPEHSLLPWPTMRRVVLDVAARRAKAEALAQHRSQIEPLSPAVGDEAVVPPGVQAHFDRDFETFVVDAPAAEPAYFDRLYAGADDPWGLDERFYESRKRDLVLASLPRPRFRRAFEPGCATGLLTARLAQRCDAVVAWDFADAAVHQARHRLAGTSGVSVERGRIPQAWPEGRFDLVVLSEVGYYCPDLGTLARRIHESLDPDGVVLAVHWRHAAADHPYPAEAVHEALGRNLHRLTHHVEDDFLLDVWSRTGQSVAAAEGMLG